jgi:predicted RNase H-like HicB family nuclease
MKETFTARTWKEGKWFIAQCVEVDVASHGRTKRQALGKLQEALELRFEPLPIANCKSQIANPLTPEQFENLKGLCGAKCPRWRPPAQPLAGRPRLAAFRPAAPLERRTN